MSENYENTAPAAVQAESYEQPIESSMAESLRLLDKGQRIDPKQLNLKEEIVQLNRTAKVVKGGRRFSFSALLVIGDGDGHVGIGFGKANEVPESIGKATEDGKKNLIKVSRKGRTIPHAVVGRFGSARVMLKPASEGTGILAGPAVRAVLTAAGVKDVLTKVFGTHNKVNVVKAVMQGLESLKTAQEIAKLRGLTVEEVFGNPPKPVAPVAAEEYDTSRLEGEEGKAE